MTHTLTVTRCEPDDDDIEYEVTGPHDDNCAVWMPCCDDKPNPEDLEVGDWHGVEHHSIEGEWMTRTTICGADESCDDLFDLARKHGLGSHPVDIEYYGDGSWIALDANPDPEREPRDTGRRDEEIA